MGTLVTMMLALVSIVSCSGEGEAGVPLAGRDAGQLLSGAEAEALVRNDLLIRGGRYESALLPGSVDHLMSFEVPGTTFDHFTWSASFEHGPVQVCWGDWRTYSEGSGGSAGCRNQRDGLPRFLVGVHERPNGASGWSMAFLDPDDDAIKATVMLANGEELTASLAGQPTMMFWSGPWSLRPIEGALVSAGGDVVQHEVFDIPPPPELPGVPPAR